MENRKNKIKIGCGIIFIIVFITLIVFIIRIYNDFSELSDGFKSIDHSTAIEFKDIGQTVFITTSNWGLLGQHSHIIISDIDHANKDIVIDKEKEIVFDERCGLYYKATYPDSLFVFMSSDSEENVVINKEIGLVKVNITKYKNSMIEYYRNYKDLGLSLISCYNE